MNTQNPQTTNAKTILRFLSERQVSEATGISVKTLQRWRLLGMGPTYRKLGGAVRYAETDLASWIERAPIGGGGTRPAA